MPDAISLIPYSLPRAERLIDQALFDPFVSSSIQDHDRALLVIAGVETLASKRDAMFGADLGRISRVECYYDRGDRAALNGMVIFTSQVSTPLVYIRHAYLGYSGSGASCGQSILNACGISRLLIAEAEGLVARRNYKLVFSREITTIPVGTKTRIAIPFTNEVGAWQHVHYM